MVLCEIINSNLIIMNLLFRNLFPLVAVLLLVVCSCKDDNAPSEPEESQPAIEIPSSVNLTPVVPQQGGTVKVSFTTTSDWTASLVNTRAESWITVSPTSGPKGEHEITITTVANESYDERNATIVLKCGTVSKNIVVSQKQKDALTVTSSKYEVDSKGGNINIEVKANIDFEVEVKADWIKQQEGQTRALTTSNLTFAVDPNETGDKREGEIVIKSGELSETVKVYQAMGKFITLTKKDFTIPEEGGSVDIEVKSTLEYGVRMLSEADWIEEAVTRAVSTHTHHYTVAPNETYDSREAKIVFYDLNDETIADTVSIFQMYKGAILVARNEYQLAPEGGTLNLTVQANLEFDVTVSDTWIQQVQPTRGLTDYDLNFVIAPNTAGEEREGTITVKAKDSDKQQVITVKQKYEKFIRLTKKEFAVPEEGQVIDVEVKSTVEYEIKMLPKADWIEEVATRAVSTRTHQYKVAPNETYDSREAKIVFYDPNDEMVTDTLSISQMYKGAILVARNEYQFDLKGGNLKLTVQANLEFDLEISDTWIQQVQPTRGLTDYDLNFVIAPNTDRKEREGTITVKAKDSDKQQVITIKQSYEDLERKALMAFYEATGGDSWTNHTNWGSDQPLSEWYGIYVNGEGAVREINMVENNLSGSLPDIFDQLPALQYVFLSGNRLGGQLPPSLYRRDIHALSLANNQLEGTLPEEIGNWKNLLSIDISFNNFSGTLPAALGKFPSLNSCNLKMNRFSGELTAEIIALEKKADTDPNFHFWLTPQQEGYTFTAPATSQMISLGDNLYLHPDGLALEYRQGVNQAIVYEDTKPLMKKVYEKFGDAFDFVVFLYNVGNMAEIAGEIAGQALPISNDVQGIGCEIFDDTSEFGSAGRLKALIQLSDQRQIRGSFLHELMHNWGALDFGQYLIDVDGKELKGEPHWGISSINGLLGGFDLATLERNVDGNPNKYKAHCSQVDWCFGTMNSSSYAYAPFELYLMGLLPAEEVPDIHYFTDLQGSPTENPSVNGIFYAGQEHVLSIQDIVSRFGTRVPSSENAQKDFNVLTIVITKDAVNDREWGLIEDDIIRMQKQGSSGFTGGTLNFYEATGGRGTLTFGNLEKHRK